MGVAPRVKGQNQGTAPNVLFKETPVIRKARITDVPAIADLITQHARVGKMLFRSHAELYETLRDFTVFESDTASAPPPVTGVCALEIVWADLAEVKSLAVETSAQGQGIGRKLVEAIVAEATDLKIQRIFALTYEQAFFEKLGFSVVEKSALPLKVWSDCLKCPKRDQCDEIAVVRTLFSNPAMQEANPDTIADLRYDVPTPLVKLNLPGRL